MNTQPAHISRRATLLLAMASCLGVCAAPALAQEAGGGPGTLLTPTLGISTGYLENRSRSVGENGREFVATLTPGISYVSRSGSLRGSLDAQTALSERRGVAASSGFDAQNQLGAAFTADIVANRLLLETRASITQQSVSAYGEQGVTGPTLGDRNRTEVRSLTLAPIGKGPIGEFALYEVRLTATASRTSQELGVGANTLGASALLRSPTESALLGWELQLVHDGIRYEGQAQVRTQRAVVGVTSSPGVGLRLKLRAGYESVEQNSPVLAYDFPTAGATLQWQPSPRTNLSIEADRRYFGSGARVGLLQRSPRTVLTYAYSRNATDGVTQSTADVTLYDRLYAAFSSIADTSERDAAVRQLLADRGQDGSQVVAAGFQTSSLSLQERQDLSLLWLGLRTTLTAQAFTNSVSEIILRSDSEPLIGAPVRQHGYSGSLVYRLTPLSSVTLGGLRQMTYGVGSQAGNDLKSAFAAWSHRLGIKTSVNLVARYTVFNSPTDPYRETSVTASLNLRF